MVPVPAERSSPFAPADELRAAFAQHTSATRFRWKVAVQALDQQDSNAPSAAAAIVRVDLCPGDVRALADLLLEAADPDDEPGPRGRSDAWTGSASVAKRLGVAPGTIRGWITRNGPKAHPFPQPEHRYRGRNYWQKRTIDTWEAQRRRLDEQYRASHPRSLSRSPTDGQS